MLTSVADVTQMCKTSMMSVMPEKYFLAVIKDVFF